MRFFMTFVSAIAVSFLCVPATYAEPPMVSLNEAMASAYQNNPRLLAARANLRSIDETYAQAVSGYRPYIAGEASYVSTHQTGDVVDTSSDPKLLAVGLTQPIYRGGTTDANIGAAQETIFSERYLLQATEQSVLLDSVTSYMNVIRDQKVLGYNKKNENIFEKYLSDANQRFEMGEITKTDVNQARTRLASSTASRIASEGRYRSSRAAYERIIGLSPDHLMSPVVQVDIPSSLMDAKLLAEENNPNVISARHAVDAARLTTKSIVGENRPQIDLTGSVGHTVDPAASVNNRVNATSIGIIATIPLYTSGATDSRIRQSRQIEGRRLRELDSRLRIARQEVIDAWAQLMSSSAVLRSRNMQIEAAETALEGVRLETEYGARTTLDLLDAEQEFLDAQVAYATTERDKIVAIYTVLATTGRLTAQGLDLNVALYDPLKNFQNVNNKWAGTEIDSIAH